MLLALFFWKANYSQTFVLHGHHRTASTTAQVVHDTPYSALQIRAIVNAGLVHHATGRSAVTSMRRGQTWEDLYRNRPGGSCPYLYLPHLYKLQKKSLIWNCCKTMEREPPAKRHRQESSAPVKGQLEGSSSRCEGSPDNDSNGNASDVGLN